MAYNGWSNWDTWNAHLWLDSNESTQDFCEKNGWKPDGAEIIKGFWLELFGTDHDRINVDEVDWQEVADAYAE